MPDATADPDFVMRLGVIGLGRTGTYLLERWLGHPFVRAVAACDHDPTALARSARLCDRAVADPGGVIDDPELDAVFVAVPIADRAALGLRVLAAGKHLVLEPPVAATVRDARSLFEAADSAGRRVVVWSPAREEADFRAASAVLRSGLVGPPRFLRFERWESMVGVDGSGDIPAPVNGLLDQLLALADAEPASVLASPLGGAGRSLTIAFQGGLKALATLHAETSVRIDHGWAIDAERGGYAAGRRWVRTAEGELYEVPAEPPPFVALEDALKAVLAGGPSPVTPVESIRLAALLAACSRSAASGRVERVERS